MEKTKGCVNVSEKNTGRTNIRWHGAFATSLAYELGDYAEQLITETEHQLSKEALRIDVLLIKKDKDLKIEKNIAKIFREHNIVEYKSPTDYLSIGDYNKIKGYAYLYSAFENVDLDQITLTFVVPEITPSLRTYLVEGKGFAISTADEGISYIADNSFGVQIIEQKKLSVDKNLFFATLTNMPIVQDWATLLEKLASHGKSLKNNPLLEVLSQVSPDDFKEAITMQTEARYEEVMRELGQKVGLVDPTPMMIEVAKKLLRVGDSLEKVVLVTGLDVETIRSLE